MALELRRANEKLNRLNLVKARAALRTRRRIEQQEEERELALAEKALAEAPVEEPTENESKKKGTK